MKQIFAVYCKYAKISKKGAFLQILWVSLQRCSSVLVPEKTFVPQGNFALNCILDSYKECFILFMVQIKYCIGK